MTSSSPKTDTTLNSLLSLYITDPSDAESNFALAQYYDDQLNQTAAAVSYYIRAAERAESKLLSYASILRAALCFERQGTRGLSVRGLLQRCIAMLPQRPEAYYHLARYQEKEQTVEGWVNSYTTASLGLEREQSALSLAPLPADVKYPGKYSMLFQLAVAAWWVGLCSDAKEMFISLAQDSAVDLSHRQAVLNNLRQMGQFHTPQINFYSKDKPLSVRFPDSDKIERNYSEAYQDIFVLAMLNGKHGGTYLEIGSGHPYNGNNTALLEKQFGWSGLSLDIDAGLVEQYNQQRKNPAIQQDATTADWTTLLSNDPYIDYLSLDVEPPAVTLLTLKNLLKAGYQFGVITYEHDAYSQLTDECRQESRRLLTAAGYTLVARNVAPDDWRCYEDWWINTFAGVAGFPDGSEATKRGESLFLLADR